MCTNDKSMKPQGAFASVAEIRRKSSSDLERAVRLHKKDVAKLIEEVHRRREQDAEVLRDKR